MDSSRKTHVGKNIFRGLVLVYDVVFGLALIALGVMSINDSAPFDGCFALLDGILMGAAGFSIVFLHPPKCWRVSGWMHGITALAHGILLPLFLWCDKLDRSRVSRGHMDMSGVFVGLVALVLAGMILISLIWTIIICVLAFRERKSEKLIAT